MSLLIPEARALSPDLPCALCENTSARRQLSHILPSFVFKHASVRSPTGYLRTTTAPNRRVQDGPKDYILCFECEQRFARWENKFSKTYKAFYAHRSASIRYSNEDTLCALSMVWRVLYNARSHPELEHHVFGADYSRTDGAFQRWSECLLTEKHPGDFRLYWLFFDTVAGGTSLPNGINSYIFHGTDFDLLANSRESFAYAHIPGLFIFGMTEPHDAKEWRDLRVGFQGGIYSHKNRAIPGAIGTLIRDKIAAAQAGKNSISQKQRDRIAKDALKDPKRLLSSPLTKAIFADLSLELE